MSACDRKRVLAVEGRSYICGYSMRSHHGRLGSGRMDYELRYFAITK
jgi:hypothetical protein